MIVQPPSVLLMGTSGSGKTYALSTLVETGLEVFLLITEPHGLETMLDVAAAKRLDISKLHWHYVGPARPGFQSLENMSKLISVSNQKDLADMKPTMRTDVAFAKLLATCLDFKDDKDGKAYGPVDKFGPERVFAVDSLSGLSAMAMDNTIGDKVTANPGEWGIAMRLLDKFILLCTSDLKCPFVLTAHIEREEDPLTGATQTMASTLGKKLAPQLPKFFSEVILAHTITEGDKRTFWWSTNTSNTVLKNRALPISSKLQPDFRPIIEAYNARLKTAAA